MENLHYAIISEDMVWIWYYDKFRGKHIKELYARDARDFIKNLQNTTAENGAELIASKDKV